jgi:hypothetical protein
MIERAAAGGGLELKAHPHMLRHACGYALANKGHDTRAIQGWLGHRSITSTAVYTALAPNRFKDFWRDWNGDGDGAPRLNYSARPRSIPLQLTDEGHRASVMVALRITPSCRDQTLRLGPGHSESFNQRRLPETSRTAIAIAFLRPTKNDELPGVIPV